MVEYKHLLIDNEPGVRVITLNRPEKMNAYNRRMGMEIRHAIGTADLDEAVRAIVVTGAGRAFCAGADLSPSAGSFGTGSAEQKEEEARFTRELTLADAKAYWEMNTPIIGAINGAAVGAGLTIPLQFDIRIVAEDAKLAFSFNRRGVLPELNSPILAPQMIGLARGLDLLITGRTFLGREAAEWGLASEALPADRVLSRALEVARDIAENTAPVSVAILKRLAWEGLSSANFAAAQARNHALFDWVTKQVDAREGPRAFMEKRKPNWTLRKNADFPEDRFARERSRARADA
jgi:enoyl-CoA hydratase/carnithine racemase